MKLLNNLEQEEILAMLEKFSADNNLQLISKDEKGGVLYDLGEAVLREQQRAIENNIQKNIMVETELLPNA